MRLSKSSNSGCPARIVKHVPVIRRIVKAVLIAAMAGMLTSVLIVLFVDDYWNVYNKAYSRIIYGSIVYTIYALLLSLFALLFIAWISFLARKSAWESVKNALLVFLGTLAGLFALHIVILVSQGNFFSN
jgi:hypothetical protein